jgi:hypothetical protein
MYPQNQLCSPGRRLSVNGDGNVGRKRRIEPSNVVKRVHHLRVEASADHRPVAHRRRRQNDRSAAGKLRHRIVEGQGRLLALRQKDGGELDLELADGLQDEVLVGQREGVVVPSGDL